MARDRIRRILPSSRLHRPIPPIMLRPPSNPECRCRSPPFLPSHHRRCATTMRWGWPSSSRTFASASATAAATNANAIPSHRKDDAVVAISSSSSSPREGSRLPPWRGGGEGLRRHHRRDDDDDDDGIDIDGERDDGTEYCSDAVVTWTAECMRSAVRCYASDVSSRGGESIKLVGILVTSSSSSSTSGREEEEEMEMDMEGNESGGESSRVDDDSHRRRRMTDDDTHGNARYSEQIAICCAAVGILYEPWRVSPSRSCIENAIRLGSAGRTWHIGILPGAR